MTGLLFKLPFFRLLKIKSDFKKKYRNEIDLIKSKSITTNNHQSIIHFSVNKAATQYVKGILKRCATHNGMLNVDFSGYAFNTNFPYLDSLSLDETKKMTHLFVPKGYLYSCFGGMVHGIPDLDKFLIILMIRDPRDLLVSLYYSLAYSHPIPNGENKKANFIDRKNLALEKGIDVFVLDQMEYYYTLFTDYIKYLLPLNNVYVTKYEDMVLSFEKWFDGLLNFSNLSLNENEYIRLIEENKNLKPRKENVNKHIRKGIIGDYREKLKDETIKILDNKFENILRIFDYS